MQGFDALVNLEELYLGKNKIERIEVRCCARSLAFASPHMLIAEYWPFAQAAVAEPAGASTCLHAASFASWRPTVTRLQSNRIVSLAGLESCLALEELYVSHNGITALDALPALVRPFSLLRCSCRAHRDALQPRLNTLDLGANRVSALHPSLSQLAQLTDLWVRVFSPVCLSSVAAHCA
jgi:hypothetical protein